jgi:hypothetical protein
MDACSFCGKAAAECERLIVGGGGHAAGNARGVAICNECIELCHRMVHGPRVAMPVIPRDVLVAAGVCPTDITEEPQALVVNCACAVEPSPEDEVRRKQLLAPYFPPATRFRYFWPVEPPEDAAEWLAMLLEAPDESGPLSQRR